LGIRPTDPVKVNGKLRIRHAQLLHTPSVRCEAVAPDLRVRRACVHDVEASDSEVRRYGSGASRAFRTGLLCVALALSASAVAQDDDAALAAVRADEARRVEVFRQAAQAVVCIFADRELRGGGSGVVVHEEGYGLTNFHVVAEFLQTRRGYGGLADGRLYPLRVLGVDPGGDIAMFKLEGKERFDFAPLGDSDRLRVGQWVAAMGNPFMVAEDFAPTITLGVISGLHRYQYGQGEEGSLLEYADCIQVSTSINPGNSGGPLFDLAGRVLGINGRASFDDGERRRVNVGLGYAVSINQIKRFLPALRAGRLCEHGTLGATVQLAGDELIFNAIQGLSAAERAGIQLGDELRALAGRPVRTPNDVNNILATLPADWPVSILLRRDGQEISTAVRLDRLPLRMPQPYILDLAHNHAEIRKLLERYSSPPAAKARTGVERPPGRWRFTQAAGEQADVIELTVSRDSGGTMRVERGEESLTIELGDAVLVTDSDAAHKAGWRNRAVWSEWQHITAPLLSPEIVGLGWELLGSDEVQGKIAATVEWRVADGQRIRWAFEYETGRLLEARVFDARHPGAVVWLPGPLPGPDRLVLPDRWTRQTGSGVRTVIEIVSDVEDTP
jgi:S1-C subfamily serine protease